MRFDKLKRLVDPARPITYGIVQAGPEFEGGIPYIRPADMTNETGVKDFGSIKHTSPEIAQQYRRSAVKTGDLVISIGPSFGKVMEVPSELDGANLTQGTARVAPGPNLHKRFAFWCLRSQHCYSQWEAGIGGATFRALNLGPLAETRIPNPDLEVQRQIADFLDRETARIDLLIEKKQRLVALLGERFEATVSHLTSPPNQDTTGWTERPIKAVCSILGRIGFRGYTIEDIVDEGEGAVTLSPSNIKDGRMTLEGRTYLSWRKYNESPEIQISIGDIIFVKTGSTIGKVAKVDELPEPMTLNPQLVVLKKVVCDRDFLLFAMQSRAFQYQVSFNRFGGSTPAMSQGHLGRLRVWLPEDAGEQQKRASLIIRERDSVDATKSSLNKSIDRLKEYRSALITAAVTGQIDVSTYAKSGATDRFLDKVEK